MKTKPPGKSSENAETRAASVVITHPDKVLFPGDGITKRDLADYYEMIAPHMLPPRRGRRPRR